MREYCGSLIDLGSNVSSVASVVSLMPVRAASTPLGVTEIKFSPPDVDRIWGTWGSYYNIPKAIFYLLKGDYKVSVV